MRSNEEYAYRRRLHNAPEHVRQAVRLFRRNPSKNNWKRIRNIIIYPRTDDLRTIWQALQDANCKLIEANEKPTRDELDVWLKVWFNTELRKPHAVL